MTDIEKKALALVNEACKSDFKDLGSTYRNNVLDGLILAIEQHEAFRQEVSDAIERAFPHSDWPPHNSLARFIIPKPDPLVEVWDHMIVTGNFGPLAFRTALAARGLKIVESE